MPVMPCKEDGKPGFKFGEDGKCYTYIPGNKLSMEAARERARNQGAAIKISQGK